MQADDQLEASTQAQPEGVGLKGPSSSCLHPPSSLAPPRTGDAPTPACAPPHRPLRCRARSALCHPRVLWPRNFTRRGAAAAGATPECWGHDCYPWPFPCWLGGTSTGCPRSRRCTAARGGAWVPRWYMPPGTKRLRALGAFSAGRCMRLLKTFSAADFGFHQHEVGVWRSVLGLNEPGILRTLGCPGFLGPSESEEPDVGWGQEGKLLRERGRALRAGRPKGCPSRTVEGPIEKAREACGTT